MPYSCLCNIISCKKYTCQTPTICPSLSPQTYTSYHLAYLSWSNVCPSLGSGSFSSDLISERNCRCPFSGRPAPGDSLECCSHGLLAALLQLFLHVNGVVSWACNLCGYPGLHAQKGHDLGLRLCCCCLEILNFEPGSHIFIFHLAYTLCSLPCIVTVAFILRCIVVRALQESLPL